MTNDQDFMTTHLMVNDDQVQTDINAESTVADPLDAANSPIGTNELAAYEAERSAMLEAIDANVEQGAEPAEFEEEGEEQEEERVSEEENEEQTEDASEEEEAEEEEGEPETVKPTSKKIRFSNPDDLAIAAIAKAKKVSLAEATDIFRGQSPSAAKPTDQAQQQEQESAESETVASVTSAIKDLQQQKREKLKTLDFDDAADLDEQIDALRDKREELKISEARSNAVAEQQAVEQFHAEYAKSENRAVGFYPDAAVKDSPLAKEMLRLESEMKELSDPLYHSADKPFILAKEAAKNLGIPMRKPGTAPVKKTVRRPIEPAGGNARTTSTGAPQAFEQEIAQLGSLQDYEQLLGR